jgi:hypothetical protein
MRSIVAALAAFCAVAGSSTFASAQGAPEWDPWGGPRRPPPSEVSPPDDRYDDTTRAPDRDDDRDYYDDRYDRGGDNRYDDRGDADRGHADRAYPGGPGQAGPDDPRRYDPRYNGDRDDGDRGAEDRRFDDDRNFDDRRGNDDRRGDSPYGDRDGYGAWDAAPSPDEEARLSKTPGTDGGSRPFIQPVTPPIVAFNGPYAPRSVVIDTRGRKLYYVLSNTSAYAYAIGVGRQGFTWTGREKVSRISDWPDWYPPTDMRKRKPELPTRMLGGIRNPLGVKAIYLGNTLYRIHGTNDPKSIGKAESSGCFRMLNENVLHLASLVTVGTEVTVVRSLNGNIASAAKTPSARGRSSAPGSPRRWDDERPYDPYTAEGWH